MTVHAAGDGVSWLDLETLDSDQPHGLDQRQLNHLAIAIRKRAEHEHSDFADATVGGIHKPGGCAVLGMEITDDAGDPTGLVVADGTYRGHGLVWGYEVEAGANKGILWCATAAAGASTTGDWTVMKLHPDLQWGGGDVTWAGAHEFDATACFNGEVEFGGAVDFSADTTLTIGGDISVGGTAHFDGTTNFNSAVDFSADVTISIGGDVTMGGGFYQDGTSNFADEVDFSAVNVSGIVSVLGTCVSQSTGSVDMSWGVVYKVATDGYLMAMGKSDAQSQTIKIVWGSANPPADFSVLSSIYPSGVDMPTCAAHIPKGYYFAVSGNVGIKDVILWQPFGAGGCVSQ